jgi:ABC-type phosphate transport system permease subunit
MAWISGVILGAYMIKLIIDVVLFSSMFTFVTGIVLAAAHVLG